MKVLVVMLALSALWMALSALLAGMRDEP